VPREDYKGCGGWNVEDGMTIRVLIYFCFGFFRFLCGW